ncbi:MAG: PAS domain S-box protein [Firmicutes bacterium]|nr:PAS domain S-box protein [Bacillota bacterium]NLY39190.1 PAS domain S-box protein [Bacillota bacterium]
MIGLDALLQLLTNFIEDMPVGVMLLDKSGTLIGFNKKQEKNSRIKREVVLNKNIAEVFPSLIQQGVEQPLARLLENQEPFELFLDQYKPQYYDRIMVLWIKGLPIKHASSSYFILYLQLFEEYESLAAHILNASPTAIVVCDSSRHIVIFNKAAEIIFGYGEDNVLGEKIDCLFPEENKTDIHTILNTYNTWEGELTGQHASSRHFAIRLNYSKISNQKKTTIAFLFIIWDITERKIIEQNLVHAEKLALLGKLAGELAHQLNNPMVGVINLTELLLSKEHDPQKQDLIKLINRAGSECREVVNNILTFSRKNISDINFGTKYCDVNEILKNTTIEVNSFLRLKQIKLLEQYHPSLPKLYGDANALKHAFLNIIMNSIEAIPGDGEIIITTSLQPKKSIEILIQDTGCGIIPENLARIFEPFFTTKNSPNTGLGLSISQRIIFEHGGLINIESTPQKGTRFLITFSVGDKYE